MPHEMEREAIARWNNKNYGLHSSEALEVQTGKTEALSAMRISVKPTIQVNFVLAFIKRLL
jgi:hypothetical protein